MVIYKSNIFSWDLNSSKNIKTELVALDLKSGPEKLLIAHTTRPIELKIKNKGLETRNVSFYYPGFVKVEGIKVTSNCKMVIGIKPLNDVKNETKLKVYVQYGSVPSPNDYDIKLNISNKHGIQIEDRKKIGKKQTSNIEKSGHFTLTMSNFDIINNTVHKKYIRNAAKISANMENTKEKLFFVFYYDGPVPPLVVTDNAYTCDLLDNRGYFNYSLQTFCVKCMYFDKSKTQFKEDGCKVSAYC